MSNDTTLPGDTTGNVSIESELEAGDVSSSTCATLSDLGETSILSGKQKQAALRWSKMEKKKAKEKEKNKQKNKITKSDFYTKSMEFKAWLQDSKGMNFEDMDPKKQKEYFKKFVRKWNSRKLDKKYYRGVDTLWAALGTPTTQVNWAMQGLQDLTPGSITEENLEEKYSRLRGSCGELGTFGKKAGAVMLQQLRDAAKENTSDGGTTEKILAKEIQNPSKVSLIQSDWPAPPSPLKDINSAFVPPSDVLAALSPLPPQPECTNICSSTFLPPSDKDKPSTSSSASETVAMESCLSPLSVPIPPPMSPDEVFTDSLKNKDGSHPETAPASHPGVQLRKRPISMKEELFHPPAASEKPTASRPQSGRSASANVAEIQRNLHAAKSVSHETLSTGGCKSAPPPPPPDRSISLDHLPQKGPATRQTAPEPPAPKLARISKVRRNTLTVAPGCHGDSAEQQASDSSEVKNKDQPKGSGDLKRRHPEEDPYISQLSSVSHAVFQTLTTARGKKKAGELTPVHTKSCTGRQKHP